MRSGRKSRQEKERIVDGFLEKTQRQKEENRQRCGQVVAKIQCDPKKKFAKLIYKLVKKYPKAIKRSTKQSAMEEMIKRATRGENMRTPPGGGASKEKINPEQRAQDFKEKNPCHATVATRER